MLEETYRRFLLKKSLAKLLLESLGEVKVELKKKILKCNLQTVFPAGIF